MAAAGLAEKITGDAERTRRAALRRAEEEAERIREEARQEAERMRKEGEEAIAKLLAENERRVESAARHAVRLAHTGLRRDCINAAFREAKRMLRELSDEEYEAFLRQLAASIGAAKGVKVIVPRGRIGVTERVMSETGIEATVEEDEALAAGFRIVGGETEYDCTAGQMLERNRPEIEAELASVFFKKQE